MYIQWIRTIPMHIGVVLYANIDKRLVDSLHGQLNCEIDGLDWYSSTTECNNAEKHTLHISLGKHHKLRITPLTSLNVTLYRSTRMDALFFCRCFNF